MFENSQDKMPRKGSPVSAIEQLRPIYFSDGRGNPYTQKRVKLGLHRVALEEKRRKFWMQREVTQGKKQTGKHGLLTIINRGVKKRQAQTCLGT